MRKTEFRHCLLLVFFVSHILFAIFGLSKDKKDLPTIYKEISPSIVLILTNDEKGENISLGRGFFISEEGDVVTNYHVLQGANRYAIKTALPKKTRGKWQIK
jgi:S1-C subfamily serine protease